MWKWSTTFGVSISFLLLRDHSLQSGLFQIPIFGDACLIPPSISISYLVISCFHEISQKIFFFFRLYVNRILFPWGVLDLLAFIPSRSAPLPIGKAVLGQRPSGPFSSSRRLVQIPIFLFSSPRATKTSEEGAESPTTPTQFRVRGYLLKIHFLT